MDTPRKPFGDHQMNIDRSYSLTVPIEIIRNDDLDLFGVPHFTRTHFRHDSKCTLNIFETAGID